VVDTSQTCRGRSHVLHQWVRAMPITLLPGIDPLKRALLQTKETSTLVEAETAISVHWTGVEEERERENKRKRERERASPQPPRSLPYDHIVWVGYSLTLGLNMT